MQPYIKFSSIKFRSLMQNRFDCLIDIIEILLVYVVFFCVISAVFQGRQVIDGISLDMAVTSILISTGLTHAHYRNQMFIQDKLKQGTLAVELIKPINFRLKVFSQDFGTALFRVVFNMLPAMLLTIPFMGIYLPKSPLYFILFIISAVLGFIVNWLFDFIIHCISFYIFSIWGFLTIKRALTDIFAGALIPLWFMPDAVLTVLDFTPFTSIFFIPLRLYLGQLGEEEILPAFLTQLFWIFVLWFIGQLAWKCGINKMFAKGCEL